MNNDTILELDIVRRIAADIRCSSKIQDVILTPCNYGTFGGRPVHRTGIAYYCSGINKNIQLLYTLKNEVI